MSTAEASLSTFTPVANLVPGSVRAGCRACVAIPARNEEGTLRACLDALANQQNALGEPLAPHTYEVLLLLNNCTDHSGAVLRAWQVLHPLFRLHVIERDLPAEQAHAGWARRLLMDTAWQRLGGPEGDGRSVILTTDADSVVAPDWISTNLAAIDRGADAVGGAICLQAEGLNALPARVRACYRLDRRYADLVAQLEAALDPQAGDPWPRHTDHFGSSLACTVEAYALAGGMPAVSPLEDEAFVDALRRADLCIRHDPEVRVYTSARLEGRARVGFAGQLRLWNELASDGAHNVQSAAYLTHRFSTLARLRGVFAGRDVACVPGLDADWIASIRNALRHAATVPAFFTALDCNALIDATFKGFAGSLVREPSRRAFREPILEPIETAIAALEDQLTRLAANPA